MKSNPTKTERKQYRQEAIESHVKRGWIVGKNEKANAVVLHLNAGKYYLCKIVIGNSVKFEKNFYRFETFERMAQCVSYNIEKAIKRNEERAERAKKQREEAKGKDARDHWSAGDVISYSWGYDQTNVDFFQVTRVSKASIWIRPVSQNSSDFGQPGGGRCQPRRGEFHGEEMRKKFHPSHPGYISFDHGCGTKWNGKALHTSSDR